MSQSGTAGHAALSYGVSVGAAGNARKEFVGAVKAAGLNHWKRVLTADRWHQTILARQTARLMML